MMAKKKDTIYDGPVVVYIGTSANGEDAEAQMVLEYTIRKNTTMPVEIHWMKQSHDPNDFWYADVKEQKGWQTQQWPTPFSGYRWGIPAACGFKGQSIYMDHDMLVLQDLAELWNEPWEDGKVAMNKGAYSDTLEITLDNKSGEASRMVKGGDGTVNIEVSGMKDLAGNTIDKTPVNVNRFQVDNTIPILQSATLSSSNPSNNLAMPGDNLTLSVQSNETLQSVTIKVDGKEMVVQGSGTAWQGSLVTDQTIQEGNLNLSVVLTDLAGNTSSSYTETTDSSKVVFDKTPPSGNLEKLFSEWSSNDNRTQVRLTLSASDNTSSEQSVLGVDSSRP